MISLNALLQSEGIDPRTVLVLRNVEQSLRSVLPWLALERPDLFRAYQHTQSAGLEKAMLRATHLASFIGHEPGRAVLAQIFKIGDHWPVTADEFWALAEHQELRALGYHGIEPGQTKLAFHLEPQPELSQWHGKLIIDWTGREVGWWRWASRNEFPVRAILEENRFELNMPTWDELMLTWQELSLLPRSWRASLAEWRGVYFIFDLARAAGYVGSAYGAENILGRWLAYASTGHGGNKQLRTSMTTDLRFSILQLTAPDLHPTDLIRLEGAWKRRLHTRGYGLNDN